MCNAYSLTEIDEIESNEYNARSIARPRPDCIIVAGYFTSISPVPYLGKVNWAIYLTYLTLHYCNALPQYVIIHLNWTYLTSRCHHIIL